MILVKNCRITTGGAKCLSVGEISFPSGMPPPLVTITKDYKEGTLFDQCYRIRLHDGVSFGVSRHQTITIAGADFHITGWGSLRRWWHRWVLRPLGRDVGLVVTVAHHDPSRGEDRSPVLRVVGDRVREAGCQFVVAYEATREDDGSVACPECGDVVEPSPAAVTGLFARCPGCDILTRWGHPIPVMLYESADPFARVVVPPQTQ